MGNKRYKIRAIYTSERLRKKLDWIREFPLTLVEAPSGYGKTTALKQFFNNESFASVPVYWLTFLGESEQASWSGFSKIIAKADPLCGEALEDLGGLSTDKLRQVESIMGGLSCSKETYIVLDNVNQIKFSEMGSLLEILSGHGGKNLHIVAVTTQVTGEKYAVAGGNHKIYYLARGDFAFTREDTVSYFKQVGINLDEEQIKSVYDSTDGWIFAIYLQMLAFMQTGNFANGDMGALIENSLWRHMDDKARTCCLALSVVTGFTMEQALYLTGCSRDEIEKRLPGNGFLNFDRQTNTFNFHSIFFEFLNQRFKELPQEEKRQIWLRAGRWAEKTGERLKTLQFYHAAGELEQIFATATTSYEIADVVDESSRHIILDLLETPREIKMRYPRTMISIALALFFFGLNEELLRRADEIDQIIEDSAIDAKEKNALRGEMELLLSFLEYNRIGDMGKRHRRALDLLGGQAKLINVKSTWTFGSPSVLYMFWRESGKLQEELEEMDRCMPVYYRLTGGHGSGAEHMMRAEALFMTGDPDSAEILCHKVLSMAEESRQVSICQCALFLLARIALFRGDNARFTQIVAEMERKGRQNTEDLCRFTLELSKGFLGLYTGRDDWVSDWLQTGRFGKRLAIMTVPMAHIIHGFALLKQKAFPQILGAGENFLELASIFPNLLAQVYILIYMSLASEGLGRASQAEKHLERALEIALPDMIYMPFAENSAALEGIMQRLGKNREELKAILRLGRQFEQGKKIFFQGDSLLTTREREVAILAKERLSAKEIARRLFISESTVNNTLSRVYEKLDVHSKSELADKNF